MNNHETSASLATLAAAAIGLGILLWWVTSAPAAVCLSKKEARELWPKRHIYWYSKDHCWSNRRGPPHGIKTDIIRETMAREELPSHDSFLKATPMLMMDPFMTWHERIEGLFK